MTSPTTRIIPDPDRHILGLCAHGHTGFVDQNFRPEWLQSQDVSAPLISACIELERSGKKVDAIAAISRARLNRPGLVDEVIGIFQNGYGQAVPRDAVDHSYQLWLNAQVDRIADELKRRVQIDPGHVQQWLAQSLAAGEALLERGEDYDSRPSVLADRPMPKLFAHSLITGMDEVLRGGYYDGWLHIIAGITKQGKSTSLRTHVLDLALQEHRSALILTEGDEGIASAQLAAAMSGIDFMTEIAPGTFRATDMESPEERQARYKRDLEYLDAYVQVYPASYCNDQALKRIVRWGRGGLKAVVIDHLKDDPRLFSRRVFANDDVGHFADFLLSLAHQQGVWIGTAGQISTASTNENMRKDKGGLIILFGSPRVGQAADTFVFQKRSSYKMPPAYPVPYAYFRVMLDRYFGNLDTRHEETPIDPKRRILEIKRLKLQDAVL